MNQLQSPDQQEQKSDKPSHQGKDGQKDLSKPLSREKKLTSHARQPSKMAFISAMLSGVSSKFLLFCPILFHSFINVDIKVLLDVVCVLAYFVTLLSSKGTGPVE